MLEKILILLSFILLSGGCGGKAAQLSTVVPVGYIDESCAVISREEVPVRVKGRIIILSNNGFEGLSGTMGAKALNYINDKVEKDVALLVEGFMPETEHGGYAIYHADLETFIYQPPGKKPKSYLFRLDAKSGFPYFLYEAGCGSFKKIF
jgi:hypothetical protein